MKEKVDYILRGRFILTMEGDEAIEGGSVVIKEGKILKIGKKEEIDELYEGEYLGGDSYLFLPGFINTHTHAAMVFLRGVADDLPLKKWLEEYIWPLEKSFVTEELIDDVVPLALAEMVRSGITTFADMYFFEEITAKWVKMVGIKGVLGEGIIEFETPSFKSPKDALEFSEGFIKKWRGDRNIFPAVAPHSPYSCSIDTLRMSIDLAKKYDAPLLIHISETKWEVDEIRRKFGRTPVGFLESIGVLNPNVVGAHLIHLDEDDIKLLKERGVGVAHNPESNAKLASGIAPVVRLMRENIKVGIATDGAASNNDLDLLGEIKFAALLHKLSCEDPTVMNAKEILRIATIGGAKVLRLDKLTGSLKEGKIADIIGFRIDDIHSFPLYDPFSYIVYSAKSHDLSIVISNGKLIYRDGKFFTIDIDEAKERVRKWEKLIKSAFLK